MTNPESDEECRKRITALVIRGETLVLIDNIVGAFGCGSLDAALTGTVWSDRILGKSETVEFPLNITWVASGNNVQIVADTSRRVCPIRLQSPEENPESRTGFKFGNITQHALQHRAHYLSAALTILRAYAIAGRPDVGTRAWGSFEGWSRVVRDALVWCGQTDPARAREEFVQFSDREAGLLRQLIAGWDEVDPKSGGLTVAEVIHGLDASKTSSIALRDALMELCPPNASGFNARSIGRKLMHFRGRNCGGRAFDSREDRKGVQRWRIITVQDAGFAGDDGFGQGFSTVKLPTHTPTAYEHAREIVQVGQPNPAKPANPALALEQGEI